MLAMDVNDNAGCLHARAVLAFFVGTPPGASIAPTQTFIVFPNIRCTQFSQSLQDNSPPRGHRRTVINGNAAIDRATFAHRANPGAEYWPTEGRAQLYF